MRLVFCVVRLENKQLSGRTPQLLFRAFKFGRMGQCDQVIIGNLSCQGRVAAVRRLFGLCYPILKSKGGGGEGKNNEGWVALVALKV